MAPFFVSALPVGGAFSESLKTQSHDRSKWRIHEGLALAVEQEFEAHIATQLGIPVEKVRESVIDLEAAEAIVRKYPDDIPGADSIVGLAYDSLFKSLCGTGKLSREQESASVAPFAFVSALAGILLGFELLRRHTRGNHDQSFNYWKVSPWHAPFSRNRRLRPRDPGCVICGNPLAIAVLEELWGELPPR